MPDIYQCKITSNKLIAGNICSLTFACKDIAQCAKPGQFVHIKCGDARLLRRPVSICSVAGGEVRIVFEIKGEGTKWLSQQSPGQTLDVLGPLGNGFDIPGGEIIVIGGGIGTPPMLYAAQEVIRIGKGTVTAIIGFQNSGKVILQKEFEEVCRQVIVTTDDGSAGVQGFVTQPLEELLSENTPGKYSTVLSCGPHIMQKAAAEVCMRHNIPCQVSLEERMGCGVGACLVCVCATVKSETLDKPEEIAGQNVSYRSRARNDGNIEMSRVCCDGPVFKANCVVW